jgi:hypothetical protein
MIPTFPLDPVIRLAQSGERCEPNETEVLVNQKGEALTGLLARFRAHRRYLVRAEFEFNLRNRETTLVDFSSNQSVRVPYRCRGTIAAGDVARAVEGLYDRSKSVTVRLEEEIQAAIRLWWEEQRDKLHTAVRIAVHAHQADIQVFVSKRLASRGIRLELILEPDATSAAPKEIGPFAFKVRVADYPDEELSLEVALELRPSTDRRGFTTPLPDADADRKEIIKTACREAVLQNVSLHQFNSDRAALEAALTAKLREVLRRYGWDVGWLIPKAGKSETPFRSHIDVKYEWPSLDGRRVPFSVRVEPYIEPEGEPVYAREGRPDLEKWFRKALEDETHKLLLQDELTALSPNYTETLQQLLARGVQQRAEKIGVKLRALVLISSLPEWRYLQDFQTEVSGKTYTTKAADLGVQFDVYVHGSFANRKDLKELITGVAANPPDALDLISAQDKVREKIREITVDAASFVMRTVNVEDYLVRFEPTAPREGAPAQPAVQDQIAARVSDELRRKLRFTASSVTVLQRDTDLIKFVRTFESAQDHVMRQLVGTPTDPAYPSEVYKVDISVRLNGVMPTKTLMLWRKKTTPEDIWKTIQDWCQVELDSAPREHYLNFSTHPADELRLRLEEALAAKAKTYFGAVVELIHLQVHAGEMRGAGNDLAESLRREQALQEYRLGRLRISQGVADQTKAIAHSSALADIQREGREREARAVADQQTNVIANAPRETLTPENIDLAARAEALGAQAEHDGERRSLLSSSPKPRLKKPAPPEAIQSKKSEKSEPDSF